MPLRNYGVLKGRVVGRRLGEGSNPHYQIHVIDEDTDYRVAVNVKSQLSPSELSYLVDDSFRHPLTVLLPDLPLGFTQVESRSDGLALDFIRSNLFNRERMRTLPFEVPGPDNDLNEQIDRHVLRVMADEDAVIYAFGERWGPENRKDTYFGFQPGNGIHDIHMNQGNVNRFIEQDGVWQDGALVFHYPAEDRWVAVFLKFQSQVWHTDDVHGHGIGVVPQPETGLEEPDGLVRIVAALVNPMGPSPEAEKVTLLNTSPEAIDLAGWSVANKSKARHGLDGRIDSGTTRVVSLPSEVPLGNEGGIITLLNDQGLKVDGSSYTREQGRREGWTLVF
jgi:uncharacterized protein YukJ